MRSLSEVVQWKAGQRKVQRGAMLHCPENTLRRPESARTSDLACPRALGPALAVPQLGTCCLHCTPRTSAVRPTLFSYLHSDTPPDWAVESTDWLINWNQHFLASNDFPRALSACLCSPPRPSRNTLSSGRVPVLENPKEGCSSLSHS